MFQGALITLLKHTDTPRAIRSITRALERSTGLSTKGLMVTDSRVDNPTPQTDWLARNGYRGITASLGNYSSYSGKQVSRDAALESATVYAGVKIISEDIGTMPLFLHRRSPDRKSTEQASDHPLYRLLRDLPNPETSAGEFRECLTGHAILCGNGFAYIQRDAGKVVALWPWQPDNVRVDRDKDSNALIYGYPDRYGVTQWHPRTDVFHLRGFTLNGTSGENILERARHVIGLTLAVQEYPARWFAQGSMLDVVIERPADAKVLTAEAIQRVKEAWVKWHQGLGKTSFEPAVLQEGMKASIITPKFSETQMIEQRKFQVLEVCRVLRLPPHKLADIERAGYNSIESENTAYRTNTLAPWDRRWAEAIHRCLLTPEEQIEGRLYAEHNMEALLRGDFSTQAEGFRKFLEAGVYSINEVRRWQRLNPTPGGDSPTIQLNRIDVAAVEAASRSGLTTVAGRTGAVTVAPPK
jgi:HK97 family phage portal protein